MITREMARNAVALLADLPKYPESEAGRKHLVDFVQRFCFTYDHAQATMGAILEVYRWCPTPADIRLVADRHRPPMESNHCPRCEGSPGWRLASVVQRGGPFDGKVYEGVAPCSCQHVSVPSEEMQIAPSTALQRVQRNFVDVGDD